MVVVVMGVVVGCGAVWASDDGIGERVAACSAGVSDEGCGWPPNGSL